MQTFICNAAALPVIDVPRTVSWPEGVLALVQKVTAVYRLIQLLQPSEKSIILPDLFTAKVAVATTTRKSRKTPADVVFQAILPVRQLVGKTTAYLPVLITPLLPSPIIKVTNAAAYRVANLQVKTGEQTRINGPETFYRKANSVINSHSNNLLNNTANTTLLAASAFKQSKEKVERPASAMREIIPLKALSPQSSLPHFVANVMSTPAITLSMFQSPLQLPGKDNTLFTMMPSAPAAKDLQQQLPDLVHLPGQHVHSSTVNRANAGANNSYYEHRPAAHSEKRVLQINQPLIGQLTIHAYGTEHAISQLREKIEQTLLDLLNHAV